MSDSSGNQPQNFSVQLTASDSNTTSYQSGDWFWINCTVAGNVSLDLNGGGDPLIFSVVTGQTILRLSVSRVNSAGTTATATYFNTWAG